MAAVVDNPTISSQVSEETRLKKVPPAISLISGLVAGGCEAIITYPFEFAKTRLQLKSSNKTPRIGPIVLVKQTLADGGIKGLYVGCSTMVAGTAFKAGVRFLTFDAIKNILSDEAGHLTFSRSLLAGMVAGCTESFLAVTPTERIKTAMIDDARGNKHFQSSMHAVKLLVKNHGIGSLYKGLVSTTIKQCVTSAVRMSSYNTLKQASQAYNVPQNSFTTFGVGAFAGIISVYASQPFDTIKSRTQSARGASTLVAARSVWADAGLKGFWRGSTMRFGRLVLSGGIVFTGYEKVSNFLMTCR